MSLKSWMPSVFQPRRHPIRKAASRRTTRLSVEHLDERVVPAAMVYQLNPYGNSSYALSGSITADGPSGGILVGAAASAAVSGWTVNVKNLSTNVTTQYTGTGTQFTSTGGLFFDGNTLKHGSGRGAGYFEFLSGGASILKEEVYFIGNGPREFKVTTEFGPIFVSGPHQNVFIPALAVNGVPVPSNAPPGVVADTAAVTASEGGTLSNTGTFNDAQGRSTVTLTATVGGVPFGTITKNDAAGTWSWSANAADGPTGPLPVTVTATDSVGAAANATFNYAVSNVPPTISLNGDAEVNEGAPYTLNLGHVTDPGTDTISSYVIHWGDGTDSGLLTGNPANTTATHTFADGPSTQTNRVTVTDEDGNVLAGSLDVTVNNVDPTAAFAQSGPTTYGQAATVAFTGQHDDSAADTAAGFHYAFSTTGDFTAVTYTSGSGTAASHDYTGLDAGDYTFYARIIDKDGGFAEYSTSVKVARATPTVTVVAAGGNYTGSAYAAAGSVVGVNNTNLGTPSFQYYLASDTTFASPLSGAPAASGSYVVVASYAGSGNYAAASASTSFSILSGQQQAVLLIGSINTMVSTGVLSSSLGDALLTKLNNAIAKLNAGNANACDNQLGAFINQVNACVTSHKITAAQAQTLIDAVEAIIAST